MVAQTDEHTDAFTGTFLDRIWTVYGHLSGIELSNMTHIEGSPWVITFAKSPGQKHLVIDDGLIKEDFKKRIPAEN